MTRLIDILNKQKILGLVSRRNKSRDPMNGLLRIQQHIEEEIKWWEDLHKGKSLKHNEFYQDLLMHREDIKRQIETPLIYDIKKLRT